MGFGRKQRPQVYLDRRYIGLNALTGIDGIWTCRRTPASGATSWVLMPLRALMGFGRRRRGCRKRGSSGLNALTGIDGIWTGSIVRASGYVSIGLNALTGIDGIWTRREAALQVIIAPVLMPLRALMGFGLPLGGGGEGQPCVLMPLRALMGFGPVGRGPEPPSDWRS